MVSPPLRLGVLGCGCIGMEHLRNAMLLPSVTLAAVADPHAPSRAAAAALLADNQLERVPILDSAEQMLALGAVDALLLCTPNDSHAKLLVELLLPTRLHLLVEKPLATTVEDVARVVALASRIQRDGRPKLATAPAATSAPLLWCGMEYRYIPAIARLIAEARAGTIGELRMLSIREHRFPFLKKVGNWNRRNERTGGTLVEKCVHFFDLMRHILCSEPCRIYASGGQEVNHLAPTDDGSPQPDILDSAYVIVDFDSGARSMLELCMFAEASKHQEELSLVGTRGKLEAFAPSHGAKSDDRREVNFRRHIRSAEFTRTYEERSHPPSVAECGTMHEEHVSIDPDLMKAGDHAGSTFYELERFAQAALTPGAQPEVTLEDGAFAVMMGVGAQRSIEQGVPIYWKDLVHEYMNHLERFTK